MHGDAKTISGGPPLRHQGRTDHVGHAGLRDALTHAVADATRRDDKIVRLRQCDVNRPRIGPPAVIAPYHHVGNRVASFLKPHLDLCAFGESVVSDLVQHNERVAFSPGDVRRLGQASKAPTLDQPAIRLQPFVRRPRRLQADAKLRSQTAQRRKDFVRRNSSHQYSLAKSIDDLIDKSYLRGAVYSWQKIRDAFHGLHSTQNGSSRFSS